jgi:hypothetical protein
MAQFYAYDFIFDNIPSQKWDLKIITFEDGSLFNGVGSTDINIITQRVLRKSKPYYLGRTQEPVLEFPLTFGSAHEITAIERDLISSWLFGRSTYKKLYILQDDLQEIYFNCFMTKPEPLYIGGVNYAFTCQVVCDSPWAYNSERITSGSAYKKESTGVNFNIYNRSSEDEYLYPKIYFQVLEPTYPFPTQIVWFVNNSDGGNSRIFNWNYLVENDRITVDNDLQIITGVNIASNGATFPIEGLLSKFTSKNWFRLIPGLNNISIYGSLYYEIKWTERLKIGG